MTSSNGQIFKQAVLAAIKATYEQGTSGLQRPDKDVCAYRGYNGTKCIIGQMIKDECYDESIENTNVSDEFVQDAIENSLEFKLSFEQTKLLVVLQECHDSVAYGQINLEEDFCDALEERIEHCIERGKLPTWIREDGKL